MSKSFFEWLGDLNRRAGQAEADLQDWPHGLSKWWKRKCAKRKARKKRKRAKRKERRDDWKKRASQYER